jgi:hydroxymethylpyrimidine kinase/phosphomethylpyrimidine kinase
MRHLVTLVSLFAACAAGGSATFDAPVVLTVAGSDSGGGAGIQADLKTCEANGAFGTTAIVALTAQNTQGVQGVDPVSPSFITAQIDSVLSDIGAHAIKTGMLPTAEVIKTVATALDAHGAKVRVIDPVFITASGFTLVSDDAIAAIKTVLVPTATVLTPNMPEAGALLGIAAPSTVDEMKAAASQLLGLGAQSVLLKGGRLAEGDMVDIYGDKGEAGVRIVELRYARIDTPNTHGAGCTLAAAVAAELAKQVHAGRTPDTLAAAKGAREYLKTVFEVSAELRVGKGERGPLNHALAAWVAAPAGGESLSATLWEDPRVVELREACASNGFVVGLARGTLPKERFAGYVAQDKFFLDVFARAYTLALAKLPPTDAAGAMELAGLVRGVVDELKMHGSYAAKWGVDMSTVVPVAATQAYVDFLNEVASASDVVACAAAMVPCMRLYAYLGQTLASSSSSSAGPCACAGGLRRALAPVACLSRTLTLASPRITPPSAQIRSGSTRTATRALRSWPRASNASSTGTPAASKTQSREWRRSESSTCGRWSSSSASSPRGIRSRTSRRSFDYSSE